MNFKFYDINNVEIDFTLSYIYCIYDGFFMTRVDTVKITKTGNVLVKCTNKSNLPITINGSPSGLNSFKFDKLVILNPAQVPPPKNIQLKMIDEYTLLLNKCDKDLIISQIKNTVQFLGFKRYTLTKMPFIIRYRFDGLYHTVIFRHGEHHILNIFQVPNIQEFNKLL